MKKAVEKVAEWSARLVLFPAALWFCWAALMGFLSSDPNDPIQVGGGEGVFLLLLAGMLFQAAVYPAPPWRNKPLLNVLGVIIMLALVVVWMGGTGLVALYLVGFVLPSNATGHDVVWVVVAILLFVFQYFLFSSDEFGVRAQLAKLRRKGAKQ